MTTAHIAIKKLYKHNKGKYQLERSGISGKEKKLLDHQHFRACLV